MKKTLGITALCLFLTACGDPEIDISSDKALQQSIQKVREAMTDEKQRRFDDALNIITLRQLTMEPYASAGVNESAVIEERLKRALAGKTGDDIIAYADNLATN